ncbi:hypothetical protein [Pediococcus stilesii]|uniref:hypothetical protein n=1 Tax=Pediococcus stilesii TaxID=331679 RepID=UPI002078B2AA|nr:hypothetical protein [Pediococcus stilesii]
MYLEDRRSLLKYFLKGSGNLTYTDIYGFKHENATVISKEDEFHRIFIIEDEQHRRFECLKENPEPTHKGPSHWKLSSRDTPPDNYWDVFEPNDN